MKEEGKKREAAFAAEILKSSATLLLALYARWSIILALERQAKLRDEAKERKEAEFDRGAGVDC